MGNTTPLNKVDASDKRRQAWTLMREILVLHHFLQSVSFWYKETECMEYEGRERRGNTLEDDAICLDFSLHSSGLCWL